MHTKTMLLLLPMLAMSACTDTTRVESRLYGEWIEVQPTHGSEIRGVRLLKGGRAESIGIHTLTLESWSVSSDRLILNGRYPEDGRSTRFSDTLDILRKVLHDMESRTTLSSFIENILLDHLQTYRTLINRATADKIRKPTIPNI